MVAPLCKIYIKNLFLYCLDIHVFSEIYALLYVIMCNLCMLEIYACQKCMNVRNLCMSGIHAELKYIHVGNI